MDALDRFGQQAVSILTSGRLAEALDLSRESKATLARYTPPANTGGEKSYTSEDGSAAKKLLLARRLVEAGVRCVSVSFSDFDTHSKNFPRMRQLVPVVDHALAALPERCRLIFIMSRQQGLSYHEIADTLGLSIKTVETQMGRALKALRSSLAAFIT